MTTERRQSSPEHREMVHQWATDVVGEKGGDYEAAAEYAKEAATELRDDEGWGPFWADVASLLTRRAMTIKGATV